MKQSPLIAATVASLLSLCFNANAQDLWEPTAYEPISPPYVAEPEPEIEMHEPVFSDGYYTIGEYISHYLYYPYQAREEKAEGTVYIQFEVSPLGKVTKIKSMKPVNIYLEDAAMWAVSLLPDFQPAQQGSARVTYRYTIPITFRLLSNHDACSGEVICI